MKKNYFLFLALLISGLSFGQIILTEDFESYTNQTGLIGSGGGAINSGDYPALVSNWTIDASAASLTAATDWAMVNNGQFEYRDVDGEVALEMTSIDISDLINISFSIDISGAGGLETSDYVNVYYAVDGGAFTLIQNWNNLGDTSHTILGDIGGTDFTSTTLTQSIAPASSLIVKIVAINGAGSEYFRLDNFTLEGVSSSCSANLAEGVATCNDNTPNMDTYNATFNFTNGTETDAFTVVASSGTPDVTMISADGTITVSGVNEGDNLTLTLTNENCSFEKTVISPVCEPTVNTCFDLSNGSELFEMTSVLTNDDDDQWTESAGTYSINGYCNGCTETTTDAWLIFGPLDVTATSNLNLALTATEQYSETDLTINYTSAYTNCPADTAWTLAETITDAGSFDVDLSAASGTAVFIGINYADSDGFSSWELSNLMLETFGTCPTLGARPDSGCPLSTTTVDVDTFNVYPNPTTTGFVNIVSKTNEAITVSVFDILGKQVLNNTVNNNVLNVSSLSTGVYIMKISQNGQSITKKLVIK